jgi:hypothetical protein
MMRRQSFSIGAVLGGLVGACLFLGSGASAAGEPAPTLPGGEKNQVCGTIVGLPCAEGHFCEFASGECQTADSAGVCVRIPDACTRDWRPVCACPSFEHQNGRTHGNDCERRASLEQKAHDGECTLTP